MILSSLNDVSSSCVCLVPGADPFDGLWELEDVKPRPQCPDPRRALWHPELRAYWRGRPRWEGLRGQLFQVNTLVVSFDTQQHISNGISMTRFGLTACSVCELWIVWCFEHFGTKWLMFSLQAGGSQWVLWWWPWQRQGERRGDLSAQIDFSFWNYWETVVSRLQSKESGHRDYSSPRGP